LIGYPFLTANPQGYLSRAFEFSRQFLFEWTVNWRFIGEEMFLSRPFSTALLATHATLLCIFLTTRWMKPAGVSAVDAAKQLLDPPSAAVQAQIARRVTPDFVLTTTLSAMIVGCLCARSLHYQFYAYIAWSTPFLLWRSGMHPILVYTIWAAQEWAWNVYPSTTVSSAIVVASLVITVLGSWFGTQLDLTQPAAQVEAEHKDK